MTIEELLAFARELADDAWNCDRRLLPTQAHVSRFAVEGWDGRR